MKCARTEHRGVQTRKVGKRVVERQDLGRTYERKVTTIRELAHDLNKKGKQNRGEGRGLTGDKTSG